MFVMCSVTFMCLQESRAINAHRMVQDFAWRKDYRRADCQLCQVKNYNLTYSLFSLQPPTNGWELACHLGFSHCGGTDTVNHPAAFCSMDCKQKCGGLSSQVDCRSVVGYCSRGVHWTVFNGITGLIQNTKRCFVRIHLFSLVLCIFNYIVFTWLSTQGKRKLWLRVSLASGREPS